MREPLQHKTLPHIDASPAPYVHLCPGQNGSHAPAEAAQPSPDALPFYWWGYQKAP